MAGDFVPRPLMRLKEARDLLGVDRATLCRWLAKGVLPHVVVGPSRLKRVYRSDVERLAAGIDGR